MTAMHLNHLQPKMVPHKYNSVLSRKLMTRFQTRSKVRNRKENFQINNMVSGKNDIGTRETQG